MSKGHGALLESMRATDFQDGESQAKADWALPKAEG